MRRQKYSLINKMMIAIVASLPMANVAQAQNNDPFLALSAYWGGRYSDDLTGIDDAEDIEFSNDSAQALSLTWHYDRDAEGELFLGNAKQNVQVAEQETDLYVTYLHFGGRILFRNETRFSTSVGMGIGATFFTPDGSEYDKEVALSGNLSLGARYQLNPHWALKADLRFYGTVLDDSTTLLCDSEQCLINVDGELFVQSELLAGIEYKF